MPIGPLGPATFQQPFLPMSHKAIVFLLGGLVCVAACTITETLPRAMENTQPWEESAGRTETCCPGTQGLGASTSLAWPCLLVLGGARSLSGPFRCRGHAVEVVESCTVTSPGSF